MTKPQAKQRAVAIGASTGGLAAIQIILGGLPSDFPASILIVLHRQSGAANILPYLLNRDSKLPVQEAIDKEPLRPMKVYLAPANYHLLVESDFRLSLTIDERVSYSRPSIDVLFETAAEAYCENLVGILLTGANHDGTSGLRKIKIHQGHTIAQDPDTAEAPSMPKSAIESGNVDIVLEVDQIADHLVTLLKEDPVE